MATAQAKETNIVTLKDVIYMYTSVSKPVAQLNTDNRAPLSISPLEFHSYEVKILISDERFKKLKKSFKGAKNLPNAKEFEKEDLLEKYSYLDEADLEDDMVLVKFSQSCLVGKADANGVRKESFPIKQIGIKGKVQDINGLTINQDTNVGNGSKGHFQFRPVETAKGGLYLYPQLVCITELVEFTGGTGGEEDYDSLGLEDLDEADLKAEATEAKKEAAVAAIEAEADAGDDADDMF